REKMSKSLGNFVTIREVLRDFPGEVIRLCLLKAPYREDVEYDQACFAQAQKEYDAMRAAIDAAKTASGPGSGGTVDALVVRTRGRGRRTNGTSAGTTRTPSSARKSERTSTACTLACRATSSRSRAAATRTGSRCAPPSPDPGGSATS